MNKGIPHEIKIPPSVSGVSVTLYVPVRPKKNPKGGSVSYIKIFNDKKVLQERLMISVYPNKKVTFSSNKYPIDYKFIEGTNLFRRHVEDQKEVIGFLKSNRYVLNAIAQGKYTPKEAISKVLKYSNLVIMAHEINGYLKHYKDPDKLLSILDLIHDGLCTTCGHKSPENNCNCDRDG